MLSEPLIENLNISAALVHLKTGPLSVVQSGNMYTVKIFSWYSPVSFPDAKSIISYLHTLKRRRLCLFVFIM